MSRETPNVPLGPVAWHRSHGMVAMRGPSLLKDERVYGASILDIAPTILSVLGEKQPKEMTGRDLRVG